MINKKFNELVELIEQRKNKVYLRINEELILLYYDVGKFLYELQKIVNMVIK